MKQQVVRAVFVGAMVIAMVVGLCTSACAGINAVQDLWVFSSMRVDSGGGTIDLAPTLVSTALGSPGPAITFPGGATFTSTTEFPGVAADFDRVMFHNTSVIPGVLSYDNNSFFSLLSTTDLRISALTIRESDTVEIELASILPEDVNVGDVGHVDYTLAQFLMSPDPASEWGLSPLGVALSRANAGLVQMPSMDGSTLMQVFNQPLAIAEGSGKYGVTGGKLMELIGAAAGGSLGGAAVGTAILGLGWLPGAIIGGASATLVTAGQQMRENCKGDDRPSVPTMPPSLLPRTTSYVPPPPTYYPPGVPEPSGMLALGTGLAGLGGVFFRRRRR